MINIKNKAINHATLNGEKHTSEKQLMKSFKNLQKNSVKKSLEIFQLALFNTAPVFKINRIKIKRRKKKDKLEKFNELPGFIKNLNARISASLKSIINTRKTQENKFYKEFSAEILLSADKKSKTAHFNHETQKKVLTKKRYLFYYRQS